jgi:putative transposase
LLDIYLAVRDILIMVLPQRIEYPGTVYRITSRGNEKKAVFKDPQDRELFLKILDQANKP